MNSRHLAAFLFGIVFSALCACGGGGADEGQDTGGPAADGGGAVDAGGKPQGDGGRDAGPAGDGGTAGDASHPDGSAEPLTVEFVEATKGPLYPHNAEKDQDILEISYRLKLSNNSGADYQDLDIVFPFPEALTKPDQAQVGQGGWYNGILRQFNWTVDWLPPEQGPLFFDVSFTRDPKIFSNAAEAIAGDVTIAAHAAVSQYNVELAKSADVSTEAHMPAKVSDQDFDFWSGTVDGGHLYLSARPRSGTDSGKGGIYRIALADGTVEKITPDHAQADYMGAFALDGDSVYYVTKNADRSREVLRKVAKDGTGAPADVAVTADTTLIQAVGFDNNALYAFIEQSKDPRVAAFRADKADTTKNQVLSVAMGTMMRNTIAITNDYMFGIQIGNAYQVQRIRKDTLAVEKLVDMNNFTAERSLACNETYCFWSEWNPGALYQIPIAGGDKKKISGTNQPGLLDGTMLYSGINGLIRVGQDMSPPEEKLFSRGGPMFVICFDADNVYFNIDGRVWKLHK